MNREVAVARATCDELLAVARNHAPIVRRPDDQRDEREKHEGRNVVQRGAAQQARQVSNEPGEAERGQQRRDAPGDVYTIGRQGRIVSRDEEGNPRRTESSDRDCRGQCLGHKELSPDGRVTDDDDKCDRDRGQVPQKPRIHAARLSGARAPL